MASPAPEDLVITQAGIDDWPVVRSWAVDEGWNPGVSDSAAFFSQDPEGFFIGRIDGEPVSAISVVNHGSDYAFLGWYLVRPDARGHGYGLTTWKTALAHAENRTVGLDGVVAQQDNYRRSGFELAHRTFRYTGTAPPARPRGPGGRCGRRTSRASPRATRPARRPTGPASSRTGSPAPDTTPSCAAPATASPVTA